MNFTGSTVEINSLLNQLNRTCNRSHFLWLNRSVRFDTEKSSFFINFWFIKLNFNISIEEIVFLTNYKKKKKDDQVSFFLVESISLLDHGGIYGQKCSIQVCIFEAHIISGKPGFSGKKDNTMLNIFYFSCLYSTADPNWSSLA